jgi:beta-glucosidase
LTDSDAFVAAWLPGTEGEGMSDVLFGDQPFTGTLSRNWPASNDQIGNLGSEANPLFKDGFGLKY